MRKGKTYIILIVILVVFFVVMFLMFGLEGIRQSKYDTTLVVDNNTVWRYKKQKWVNIIDYKSLDWKKFTVFENREKKGNYYLWHDDKWYAFDNKKNAVNIEGDLFAYKSNYEIPVYNYEELEIDDYNYVYKVLEDNNLPTSSKFTTSYKVSFDFDNDEEIEDFYVISNAFAMDFDPDYVFSIVFMVKSDIIYPLYNDVSQNTSFNGCMPYFNNILDVDNDNVYDFIISCSKYSVSDTINMLYKYKNKEFKIVISNQ